MEQEEKLKGQLYGSERAIKNLEYEVCGNDKKMYSFVFDELFFSAVLLEDSKGMK